MYTLIKEWKSRNINEDKQYYYDKGYISDNKYKSLDDLILQIRPNLESAFNKFIEKHQLPITTFEIDITDEGILNLTGNIDNSNLGIFSNVFSKCVFKFFSGRKISYYDVENEFLFIPLVWLTLSLSFELKSGGSNGMEYPINNSNQLYYDINASEFLTIEEVKKLHVNK